MKTWVGKVLALLAIVVSTALFADDGKISGLAFGDLYYVPKHNNTSMNEQQGFWFRRIYLGYDKNLSEDVSTRLRFEMNGGDPYFAAPATAATASSMTPFVKDAFLKWKLGDHNLLVGISSTPSFDREEQHWGLRFVEKTPLDLWGFASSRDFGVALQGKCMDGAVNYHAMVSNGSGTGHEVNKEKKMYFLIAVPFEPFVVEAYTDYATLGTYTLKGFFGYKAESLRAGALYSMRHAAADSHLDLVSGYVAGKLGESLWTFVRVDKMLDNPSVSAAYIRNDKTSKPMLALLGIDYEVVKDFHVAPNIETVFYEPSIGSTDYFARVTFSYSF